MQRVRSEIRAARPDDGHGFGIYGDPRESRRGACLRKHWSSHAVEDIDLGRKAVGEVQAQDAVLDDGHGGDVRGQSDHRRGSIS